MKVAARKVRQDKRKPAPAWSSPNGLGMAPESSAYFRGQIDGMRSAHGFHRAAEIETDISKVHDLCIKYGFRARLRGFDRARRTSTLVPQQQNTTQEKT